MGLPELIEQDMVVGSASNGLSPSPVRRRPRMVNDRRPASGLVPSISGRAGSPSVERVPVDTGLRMGRWTRLAATVTVTIAGLAVLVAALSGGSTGTAEFTVQSGDTLWSVAEQISVQADPYEVMQQIDDLNPGDQTVLLPGTVITVPLVD